MAGMLSENTAVAAVAAVLNDLKIAMKVSLMTGPVWPL
jgi:hypothetical protein